MMTTEECILYDRIVEWKIATPEELNLARNLWAGSWTSLLNRVCEIRTGYDSLDDYLESEVEGED